MINNIKRNYEKNIRVWVFSLSVLLWIWSISWCAEVEEETNPISQTDDTSSSDNTTSTNTWTTEDNQVDTSIPVLNSKVYSWKVTWETYWADISLIDPLTGTVLLSWIKTDNKWKFEILATELEAVLLANNLTVDSIVLIEAEWWTIKDWNWDGVLWDAKSVLWKFKSVISLNNLDSLESEQVELLINVASTIIAEILVSDYDWVNDFQTLFTSDGNIDLSVYNHRVKEILNELFDWDINWDFEFDFKDVLETNVTSNTFRDKLLDWISLSDFLDSEKAKVNLVFVESRVENQTKYVTFTWSDLSWYVEYKYEWLDDWIYYNKWDEISLYSWEKIYYREKYAWENLYSTIKEVDYNFVSETSDDSLVEQTPIETIEGQVVDDELGGEVWDDQSISTWGWSFLPDDDTSVDDWGLDSNPWEDIIPDWGWDIWDWAITTPWDDWWSSVWRGFTPPVDEEPVDEIPEEYIAPNLPIEQSWELISSSSIWLVTDKSDVIINTGTVIETVIWVDQNEVDRLNSQKSWIESNISTLELDISSASSEVIVLEKSSTDLESDNAILQSEIDWFINSFITMLDALATANTEAEIDKVLDDWINWLLGTSSLQKAQLSTTTFSQMLKTNSGFSESEINSIILKINNRITRLQNELDDLKAVMDEKKLSYDIAYQNYLDWKDAYESDQADFTYWYNRYYEYKDLLKTLSDDYSFYKSSKNLASDNLAITLETVPKNSDFDTSTYTNSSYILLTRTVTTIDFSYRWKEIKWYFQFSAEWWFPWLLWLEDDWEKSWSDISIKGPDHLDALDDIIVEAAKFRLDYVHYSNLVKEVEDSWNLETYESLKDEAYINTLVYWLVAQVWKDLYQSELDAYNSTKDEYDILKASKIAKETELSWLKLDLQDIKDKNAEIVANNNQITINGNSIINLQDTVALAESDLVEEKNSLITVESQIEAALLWEEREVTYEYNSWANQTLDIWKHSFNLQLDASYDESKTPAELNTILANWVELIENNIEEKSWSIDFKSELFTFNNQYIYYINWVDKYPALFYSEVSGFWITRQTPLIYVEGPEDDIDSRTKLENISSLASSYDYPLDLRDYATEENGLESDVAVSMRQDDWNLWKFRHVVHYHYDNLDEQYPAKVWIEYSIWNHKYHFYDEELAIDPADKEAKKDALLSKILKQFQTPFDKDDDINKWTEIWWWSSYWRNISIFWWAYRIYEVDWKYIWTYIQNEGFSWKITWFWDNSGELKTSIETSLDDWVDANPPKIIEDIIDDTVIEPENIEEQVPVVSVTTPVVTEEEYNQSLENLEFLYDKLTLECQATAEELIPISMRYWSLSDWETRRADYVESCSMTSNDLSDYKDNFIKVLNYIFEVNTTIIDSQVWFATWYWTAIYDTANFISSLSKEELLKMWDNLKESLWSFQQYIEDIWAYWTASMDYKITWDPDILALKNQLALKISISDEIYQLELLIDQIDFDKIEDKDYWAWYISWYLTENIVVWLTVWKAVKWMWKYLYNKIQNKVTLLKNASSTVNAFKNISNIDDILDVANINKLDITNPKWSAIVVSWWKKSSDVIIEQLKNNGWKLNNQVTTDKWNIYVYLSPDWLNKVNYRNFDSSWWRWLYEWYSHNWTIDTFKNWVQWKEIKFLTLNK